MNEFDFEIVYKKVSEMPLITTHANSLKPSDEESKKRSQTYGHSSINFKLFRPKKHSKISNF